MNVKSLDGYERIDIVEPFENELNKLYTKNQKEKHDYLKFLQEELHKIENRNEHINRAEPIQYKDVTLYSIRKRMKKNTRVLYYYMKNNRILLLTAFVEKNDSDYENGKKRAYSRLKSL